MSKTGQGMTFCVLIQLRINLNSKTGGFMRNIKYILLAVVAVSSAFANDIGLSTHPFTLKNKVLNTELDYIGSNGTGTGVSARYFQRLDSKINFDAGFGVNSGDRENRIFGGVDYVLFPDYGNQPRVSVKGLYSYSKEFNNSVHMLGFAPTLSKGFNVSGREVFPFVAIPLQLALNSDKSSFETVNKLNIGATARMPFQGYENLTVNFETQFDLRNSYNAVALGIALPIN